jgi:hypothetical protein
MGDRTAVEAQDHHRDVRAGRGGRIADGPEVGPHSRDLVRQHPAGAIEVVDRGLGEDVAGPERARLADRHFAIAVDAAVEERPAEASARYELARLRKGSVVPALKADLKPDARFARCGDDAIRSLKGLRDRFFDEDVLPRARRRDRMHLVEACRGRDHHSAHLGESEHRLNGCAVARGEILRDSSAGRLVRVRDREQTGVAHVTCQVFRVASTHEADADHTDADRFWCALQRRPWAPSISCIRT